MIDSRADRSGILIHAFAMRLTQMRDVLTQGGIDAS